MYFPKLTILNESKSMNDYLINKIDSWLASQSEMYVDYLNPLDFIEECQINRKLGFMIFGLCSSKALFKKQQSSPILKVKYILDCPNCDENITTFFSQNDIPDFEVECLEDRCEPFIPSLHPEKINIFFELLDEPIIEENEVLQIFEKKSQPPLTLAEGSEIRKLMWEAEESKIYE